MKYLIINADDFGYTESINRGILEALNKGAVTSTSVMVDGNVVSEVSQLKDLKNISIGLHVHMEETVSDAQGEFDRQMQMLKNLLGRAPDHIDVHKPRSTDMKQLLPLLQTYSNTHHIPVRELGHARTVKDFFGIDVKGGKEVDPNRVSIENLIQILEGLSDRVSELMTHVGYSDDELRSLSSYSDLRETELKTLTSPEVREYISNRDDLELVSWNNAPIKFSEV